MLKKEIKPGDWKTWKKWENICNKATMKMKSTVEKKKKLWKPPIYNQIYVINITVQNTEISGRVQIRRKEANKRNQQNNSCNRRILK